jgi:hypothetical protein
MELEILTLSGGRKGVVTSTVPGEEDGIVNSADLGSGFQGSVYEEILSSRLGSRPSVASTDTVFAVARASAISSFVETEMVSRVVLDDIMVSFIQRKFLYVVLFCNFVGIINDIYRTLAGVSWEWKMKSSFWRINWS